VESCKKSTAPSPSEKQDEANREALFTAFMLYGVRQFVMHPNYFRYSKHKPTPMTNAHIKIAGIGILIVATISFFIYYFNSGRTQSLSTISVNPAFGEFITSYTAGAIGSGSSIRIVLTQDIVDSSAVGTAPDARLFSVNPSTTGSTLWLDRRTVEFKPAKRLRSGQVYEVAFNLSKLMNVQASLATFRYTIQVIPQDFDLMIENIGAYANTDLARQKIEGRLTTADYASEESVENVLQAVQDQNVLAVDWVHSNEGREHAFTIDHVVRKETAGKVSISLDGGALGVSRQLAQDIDIPALGDFKVMNVQVEQEPTQSVVIRFSDPLKERQNLNGLIRIDGLAGLEYEINGNEVRVFPPLRQSGSKTLYVDAGISNVLDYKLKSGSSFDVGFEQLKPAVRFVGKGTILPSTEGLIMPFEAVSLKAVDVTVLKIYERNILQFLQVNNLDGNYELRRVGVPVIRKMLRLDNAGIADLGKWNRFTLDLSKLMATEPGAIYQVRMGFRRSYAAYHCDGLQGDFPTLAETPAFETDIAGQEGEEESYWDSYQDYYYGDNYDWQERDNPCHDSYFTSERNILRNMLASDLGLVAKRGSDGKTHVIVNDLKTTQPLSGVLVELYDFQHQLIGTAATSAEGLAVFDVSQTPFALIARSGSQRGYLKLTDGESLSLSNFNVGGERVDKGLKGFLYGERGVWRPGDSLYLTFLLEDKLKILPQAHPVVFELQNPMGQVTNRLVRSASEKGFYNFATATPPDAPTGNWLGRVKVGGAEFTQPLKIETIKPNRLKINLDFGVDKIKAGKNNLSGNLQVNWLHGAPAKNLRTEFEVLMTRAETTFESYPNYVFDNPVRDFYSEAQPVFEGYTNSEGKAIVNASLEVSEAAPGKLNAIFRGKVFEASGNFSVDRFVIPYYPFSSFTGLRLPPGDKRGMLLTDTLHRADVVTVDAEGKPLSGRTIEMSLYKMEWKWWWDNSGSNANYMSGNYAKPLKTGRVKTMNGKASWNFKVDYPEWGRFLVKAYDPESGHSTGKIVYIDWPGWAGRSRGDTDGATMLSFSSDKAVYAIGEKVNLTIPGSGQGRALVSIENGSRVIQTFWVETRQGDNLFSFEAMPGMAPNAFVHVTLLQPHGQAINDLPIRLYGIVPLSVEDPSTHLEPAIDMPEVLEPGKEVVIKVSEKNRRNMTYTVAVVDEGLLDLTKFTTPDAWKRFYAKEALGVKTWDLYDEVMGAFGGRVERLLAIGGDGETGNRQEDGKANRFKPVVKFFGPYTLEGKSNVHRFVMPSYIGSVKTMLVAGYDGAYGKAEKVTPVRKPLMVLATLPRVLSPEEKLKLPITVFVMEQGIQNVKIEVRVTGPLALPEGNARILNLEGKTDVTIDFDLDVKSATGVAKVEVIATSANYRATDFIEIDVRNPNPVITKAQDTFLEAGKSWNSTINPVGVAGTNTAVLEISRLPPINLDQRMKYLLAYPYGCIEQTTSSVFPQLYLDKVKVVTEGERTAIQNNIKAALERLKLFVTRDGGFSYWPGGNDTDSWGSSYAGHFLLEAAAQGYFVHSDLLKGWKKYQRNKAQSWRNRGENMQESLNQAYRLYTLALSGDPELGAMNRLREEPDLPFTARWMLAAAYVKAGQPEASQKLIANLPTTVRPYQEMAFTYGSDIRDKAIILETLLMMGDKVRGFELLKDISVSLGNSNEWMSTQTLAWCLKAVGAYAGVESKGDIRFTYTYNEKAVPASTELPVAQVVLPVNGAQPMALQIENTGQGGLYVNFTATGIPARGDEDSAENNLKLAVSYNSTDGNPIDPTRLEQGQEFVATVTISNPGLRGQYKNLALSQLFPSGWEINNLRMEGSGERLTGDLPTYQDIRDDRVYTYFDLNANQQKSFRILLTATYAGYYYLPAVSCEAMYDRSVYARQSGRTIEVVKGGIP